jgi:predicted GNAT family acetyltransferase
MAWELAQPVDLHDIVDRLTENEWQHVAFSSRLMEKRNAVFPNPRTVSIYLNRLDGVTSFRETLLVNRGGLVLPVLADGESNAPRFDVSELIYSRSRPLHSIMGETTRVARVEKALDRPVRAKIDYYLMVHDPIDSPRMDIGTTASVEKKMRIHRAKLRDTVSLYPLQREYEKEEVLLKPDLFNASASYLSLQRHLKQEIIFYAELDKRIVAKAGTNAQGIGFDQLGGVFTIPEFRNRGVATVLLQYLVDFLTRNNRGVCLFVKRDNPAALRLYTKLGFSRRGGFRITYYS